MKNFITLSWIAICFFIIPKQSKSQNLIISGGNDFSVAVCENGYVFTWGRNNQNQMGLSSDGINPYPAGLYNLPQRVFGLEQVERVDAGSGNTSVALTCSGRVQTWGSNEFGELGNGRPTSLMPSSAVPQYVLFDSDNNGIPDDTLRNIKVVSGGNDEIFAITADNRLVSWGENNLGQLGNGTTINRNFANYVLDGTTGLPLENVITVEAGDESGYALIDNDGDGIGTVYSWGSNGDNLELGRSTAGTFDGRSFPVVKQDNSPLTDIRILSAGDRHVLALDVNGNIWSWGGDWGNGQLGQTTSYDSNPYARKVAGGESGALKSEARS